MTTSDESERLLTAVQNLSQKLGELVGAFSDDHPGDQPGCWKCELVAECRTLMASVDAPKKGA